MAEHDPVLTAFSPAISRPPATLRAAGAATLRARRLAVRHQMLGTALLLLVAAFSIRASQFGNPLVHVDEDFYLLVGDRMLHGALPYVDIWDRKPIGIFLIYAAIRLLGGSGIVQYQVVATLFAAATAFVIARIAARVAAPAAATAAGILYLLLIGLAGGMGGQTPIFYNLLVAGAALATLKITIDDQAAFERLRWSGAIAMVLVGAAMQIKYTAMFEGVFFGIVLLHRGWRMRQGFGSLAVDAALWITLAVLPTLAALGYYAWRGQTGAFIYANFLSIGARSAEPAGETLLRLRQTATLLALPLFCVPLSVALKPWRLVERGPAAFHFIMAWLAAAFFGYAVFGTYFNHYALPLMVPLAVGCAPLFSYRRHRIGMVATCVLLLTGSITYAIDVHKNRRARGGEAAANAMVAAIRPRLTNCLFVYDGDAILYYLVPSCIPTRYAFPQHLNLTRESGAIGTDPLAEIRRIFAGQPSVVVDTVDREEPDKNPAATALARAVLRRDYRPAAFVPHGKGTTIIYERLKGAERQAPRRAVADGSDVTKL